MLRMFVVGLGANCLVILYADLFVLCRKPADYINDETAREPLVLH